MKKCYNCDKEKPYEEFYQDSYSNDGFSSACKVCRREISNKDYKSKELTESQKQKRREAYKKWKANNPERFKELTEKHNKKRKNASV
jgi:hypothetical protein